MRKLLKDSLLVAYSGKVYGLATDDICIDFHCNGSIKYLIIGNVIRSYYRDGSLHEYYTETPDGCIDGVYISLYRDGGISTVVSYSNGDIVGERIIHSNGPLEDTWTHAYGTRFGTDDEGIKCTTTSFENRLCSEDLFEAMITIGGDRLPPCDEIMSMIEEAKCIL